MWPQMGSGLPPEYREHAANIARWFPEVLLTLGAPNLEESFLPLPARVVDRPQGRTLEVALRSRQTSAVSSTAPLHGLIPQGMPQGAMPRGRQEVLQGLSGLAADFERLAAQLEQGPPGAVVPSQRPDEFLRRTAVHSRIDMVTEEVAQLTKQLLLASAQEAELEALAPVAPAQAAVPPSRPSVLAEDQAATAVSSTAASTINVERSSMMVKARTKACGYSSDGTMGGRLCMYGQSAEKDNNPTPHSARGDRQVRQGGSAKDNMGRSRMLPAKAAAWRSERESLKIAITKVQQLKQEPMSPKIVKRPKVWGNRGHGASRPELFEDRSADAIKQRIERKLSQMFGESQGDRGMAQVPRKHPSL